MLVAKDVPHVTFRTSGFGGSMDLRKETLAIFPVAVLPASEAVELPIARVDAEGRFRVCMLTRRTSEDDVMTLSFEVKALFLKEGNYLLSSSGDQLGGRQSTWPVINAPLALFAEFDQRGDRINFDFAEDVRPRRIH